MDAFIGAFMKNTILCPSVYSYQTCFDQVQSLKKEKLTLQLY